MTVKKVNPKSEVKFTENALYMLTVVLVQKLKSSELIKYVKDN